MLNYDLIKDTHKKISPYIFRTPLDQSTTLSSDSRKVYLKNEGLQHTRSFKLRGAFSKLISLTKEEREKGVVAISSGNHGIAVSYAAQLLGIDNVLIFVPKNTPTSKTKKIAYYGATVIVDGETYDDAHRIGTEYINTHDMVYIDGWDKDPIVYAGQGTIALEILDQNPNIDTILVPVGGGGMVSGIAVAAKHLKPSVKVIGIQTEACPALKASISEKIHYHEYPTQPSICEALVGGIGHLAYELAPDYIDDILIVKEASIRSALKHMIVQERIIIEASSSVVVAALKDYPHYDFGNHVALVLSGNNIDLDLMKELISE